MERNDGDTMATNINRRLELIKLVEEIVIAFDRYKVTGPEKCYVGILCQAALELDN